MKGLTVSTPRQGTPPGPGPQAPKAALQDRDRRIGNMNGLSVSTLRQRTPRRPLSASPAAPNPAIQLPDRPRFPAPGTPPPSGPARAVALRPPDLDAYAAAGGPVARSNPLITRVVAGSRITIDRSFIGLLQCGQAQPSTSNTRCNNSPGSRRPAPPLLGPDTNLSTVLYPPQPQRGARLTFCLC